MFCYLDNVYFLGNLIVKVPQGGAIRDFGFFFIKFKNISISLSTFSNSETA